MTEDDIRAFVARLPGVVTQVADEASGAPEIAWGDTFFFHGPDGDGTAQRMPFATIVTKDYTGFDTASNLDRPGVFRLNIGVGREVFEKLFGYPPADHAAHAAEADYTALDRFVPHPAYAVQGWASVLNPGDATSEEARTLLTGAHERAARRRPQQS